MDVRTFFQFNRQVRQALFEPLATLPAAEFVADVGISFGSLRNTLFHILRVEDFWVHVFLQGGAHRVDREEREEIDTVASLAERWDRVSSGSEAYLDGLNPEALGEVRERSAGSQTIRKTVEEYLFTFLVHEVYHKGEVLAVLWQKGFEELPPVDFWRY